MHLLSGASGHARGRRSHRGRLRDDAVGIGEVAALREEVEALGREVAELKATLARLAEEIATKH